MNYKEKILTLVEKTAGDSLGKADSSYHMLIKLLLFRGRMQSEGHHLTTVTPEP